MGNCPAKGVFLCRFLLMGGMGCASVGTYFMYRPKADAVGGLKKVEESRFQKLTRDK